MFVGEAAQAILAEMETEDEKKFRKKVRTAYRETSEYLKQKLPLENKNLCLLSTLDPELRGHSRACTGLQDLFDLFPTVVKREDKDNFTRAASSLQTDSSFLSSITEKKLDLWWAQVLCNPNYIVLSPVVKACLSIFTGPRVESSFSVNILKQVWLFGGIERVSKRRFVVANGQIQEKPDMATLVPLIQRYIFAWISYL